MLTLLQQTWQCWSARYRAVLSVASWLQRRLITTWLRSRVQWLIRLNHGWPLISAHRWTSVKCVLLLDPTSTSVSYEVFCLVYESQTTAPSLICRRENKVHETQRQVYMEQKAVDTRTIIMTLSIHNCVLMAKHSQIRRNTKMQIVTHQFYATLIQWTTKRLLIKLFVTLWSWPP